MMLIGSPDQDTHGRGKVVKDVDEDEAGVGGNKPVSLVTHRIHDLTQQGLEWDGRGTILDEQVHAPR